MLKFRQHVFIDFHIRQVVRLHIFNLRRKAPQGFQRMTADEIRKHTAKQGNSQCDIPVRRTERFLGAVYNNGKLFVHILTCGVKGIGQPFINVAEGGHINPDGIHIVLAGIANQAIHQYAGYTNQTRGDESDSPLQG